MVAYKELLEEVDACVFTGMMLDTDLNEFEVYVNRWARAIKEHKEALKSKAAQFDPEGTVILGINIGNSTIAEYLLEQYNQKVLLDTIIDKLRKRGEWGRRGLYNRISSVIKVTSAHVGQVLTGKKNITEQFLLKIVEYLEK